MVLAAEITAKMAEVGDAVHLEFSGLQEWNYDLKKIEKDNQNVIEMSVPPMSETTLRDLRAWTNSLVKRVEVDLKGVNGQQTVRFFLTDAKVESFDYLTDQPSRLIVDFFKVVPQNEIKAVEKKEATEKTSTEPVALPSQKVAVKKLERKPASDLLVAQGKVPGGVAEPVENEIRSGIFDGGDPNYERFSIRDYEIKPEAILRSKKNVYLPFPMLKLENPHLDRILKNPPIYQIVPKESQENQEARLLLTLFNNKRPAVFLKTAQLFLGKYPNSDYKEMVLFMIADANYNLWVEKPTPQQFEVALLRYREAIAQFPKSPLTSRSWMLMGFSYLDRGDALNSIRIFQKYIAENPESKMKEAAQLALAEASIKLNRVQDALSTLDEIELKSNNAAARAEAAYGKGDIHFQAKDYNRAVEAYQRAFNKDSSHWQTFPNAFYNTAESLFWLGQYRKSLDAYRDYLKRFPAHSHAGYAMTRLGELLEILGADQGRVMGTYLEAYFRYGESPSAAVARLRLWSQKMKNMKPKELENTIASIRSLAEKTPLPKMDEFSTIIIADGQQKRGDHDNAIQGLEKYYQANPTTTNLEIFTDRIVSNMTDKVRSEVDNGKYLEALKYHAKNKQGWLKTSKRIDMDYLLGRSFEKTGIFEAAESYYKKLVNNMKALNKKEDQERRLFETYPNEDQMNLRLANVNFESGKYNDSYGDIQKIETVDRLNDEEKVERVQLAAGLMEKRGDLEASKRYLKDLIDQWKGDQEKLMGAYDQLASLELALKNEPEAEKNWKKVHELKKANTNLSDELYAKSLKSLGDLLLKRGDGEGAATYYAELLQKFEDKKALDATRFELGQIAFKRGDLQKAKDAWEPLNREKSMTWYNLAQEKMKTSDWAKDYRKYIERIPATENSKKQ